MKLDNKVTLITHTNEDGSELEILSFPCSTKNFDLINDTIEDLNSIFFEVLNYCLEHYKNNDGEIFEFTTECNSKQILYNEVVSDYINTLNSEIKKALEDYGKLLTNEVN